MIGPFIKNSKICDNKNSDGREFPSQTNSKTRGWDFQKFLHEYLIQCLRNLYFYSANISSPIHPFCKEKKWILIEIRMRRKKKCLQIYERHRDQTNKKESIRIFLSSFYSLLIVFFLFCKKVTIHSFHQEFN